MRFERRLMEIRNRVEIANSGDVVAACDATEILLETDIEWLISKIREADQLFDEYESLYKNTNGFGIEYVTRSGSTGRVLAAMLCRKIASFRTPNLSRLAKKIAEVVE